MTHAAQSWAQTRDINLAAALASYADVKLSHDAPVQKFLEHETGREFYVFKFIQSERTREVIALWNDPDLITKHPEHPVAYMQAFMHNRNRYLDCVKKQWTWNIVKRDGRIYFIPKEANGQ